MAPSRESVQLLDQALALSSADLRWLTSNLRAHLKELGSLRVHEPVQNGANEPVHEPVQTVGAKPVHCTSVCAFSCFSSFWSLYPRKTGKKEALRVWNKLKPNHELIDRILVAVRSQKTWAQWTEENGRFIPHPKTWLNQGRWDDEPMVQSEVHRRFSTKGQRNAENMKTWIEQSKPSSQPR